MHWIPLFDLPHPAHVLKVPHLGQSAKAHSKVVLQIGHAGSVTCVELDGEPWSPPPLRSKGEEVSRCRGSGVDRIESVISVRRRKVGSVRRVGMGRTMRGLEVLVARSW